MVPRFLLWPTCRDVDVRSIRPATPAVTRRAPPPLLHPTVQNLTSSSGERRRGATRHERTVAEESGAGSGEARPADPEEAMLRRTGDGGSKLHRRSRLLQRRATAAAPVLKEASSALEAPVLASVEETSFTFEFRRGLKRAKKADSPSMEAPAGEENLREGIVNKKNVVTGKAHEVCMQQGPEQVELTHCAPSIVARLMGLDTMPRPTRKVLDRCQCDVQTNRQQRQQLSGGVQEAARVFSSGGDQPRGVSGANELLPALKDVFEVSEMENTVMNQVALRSSGNRKKPHLRSSEADLEFVRRKFMDVKRLSTDEEAYGSSSKELDEALEILHSRKDVFLEILQDNNRTDMSGFSGNIFNYSSGLQSSPHAASADHDAPRSFEQENLCNVYVGHEGAFDAVTVYEEPISNILLKETSVTPLKPFEQDGSKSKLGSGHRSHIVVLKPNLRRKSFTPVLSSQEASQYDRRNGKQCVKSPKQAVMHSAPNNEVSERGGIMIQRARKETPKSAGRRRSLADEECELAVDSERVKVASTYDDPIPICSSSTGSSVSRKARRHLSERWQTACQYGSENSLPRDIKTLGEMLELSDRDATKAASSQKRPLDPMFSNDNARQVPASPLGISSKDGWTEGIYCEHHSRGGISRNFSRSKSLPASSTSSAKLSSRRQSASTCRLPILKDILNTPTEQSENAHVKKRSSVRNAKQKNENSIVQVGKENKLPEKEIYVTSEKKRHSICISDLPQAANMHPDDAISSRDQQAYEFAVQHKQATSFPGTGEDKSIYYQDIIILKEGRNTSIDIDVAEDDTEAIQSAHIASAENYECSSPTASLQQSSGEDMSYSGIFNSINVGIQGLREQLKMLKTEDQDDPCGYYLDTFPSDECSNMNISTYQEMEEEVPLFKDGDDRDFSYVQDMLASVRGFSACPEDWKVSSDVFLGLEIKYNKLFPWSKSDRKLLFDLVNSVLSDMTAPSSSLHPKIMVRCLTEMEHGQFANYVWQMVQKQRCYEQVAWDCILPSPFDHHSELELIKMEIFKMIHDDIIEESIIAFMSEKN